MHYSKFKLKKPIELEGELTDLVEAPIWTIRYHPTDFDQSTIQCAIYLITFKVGELESLITPGERINIDTIGDDDVLARMRRDWDEYRAGKLKGLRLIGD